MIRYRQQPIAYKIFVASPGDVAKEREAFFRMVDEVNKALEILQVPARLKVYAWEPSTYPDVGLPETVILDQIPLRECDIFVAILWKRFGTPPGTINFSNGRPYLSGTEQEIEEAIAIRTQNNRGRPVIMIYRKIDPISPDIPIEDLEQLQRLQAFMQKFEAKGEHPALVVKFRRSRKKPFESLVYFHLLRAVWALLEKDQINVRLTSD